MTHQPSQTTLLPSAADVIVRQLAACGIDYVFANGGTDFPPIVEAYAQAQERGEAFPQPMVIPHENAAVAMAHGVYLSTGRPQAVMVHVNVGTANALNGLLNASRENIPMLVMAGRSPYSEHGYLGTRTRYIHWAQEMFDQAGMVREAVKGDYELHLPDQAADCVVRMYEVAMTSPRGPTYLTLPRDTLAAPCRIDASPPRRAVAASALPDHSAVATAAEWLAAATLPVIVTANAGRSPEGFSALAGLAEQYAIPVTSFHPRFANLPSSHPMHAGYQPGPYVQEADVIVVVDCDVPWVPSLHQPKPDCRVIHIGEEPGFTRYPMRSFPVDLAIAGDTPKVLQAICAQAGEMKSARLEARRATLAARLREQRLGWAAKAAPRDGAITPEYISRCVAQAVGEEAVIVNEYPLRLEQCPRERPGTYFGLSPAGGLGWGLGGGARHQAGRAGEVRRRDTGRWSLHLCQSDRLPLGCACPRSSDSHRRLQQPAPWCCPQRHDGDVRAGRGGAGRRAYAGRSAAKPGFRDGGGGQRRPWRAGRVRRRTAGGAGASGADCSRGKAPGACEHPVRLLRKGSSMRSSMSTKAPQAWGAGSATDPKSVLQQRFPTLSYLDRAARRRIPRFAYDLY